ncbi:MAG: ROK family protein [Boseongicola sp.]|nr:MAG: ROK family protein [Boseongicola sp.]
MVALSEIIVGANAERSRSHNRQMVLGRVRAAGEIGRAEIAKVSGLSTQAVSNIIADLLQDDLIVETGRRTAGRGLPAVQYALNPLGGFAAGVEIRSDAVFAALLDLCGNTLASQRTVLKALDRKTVTQTVVNVQKKLLTKTKAPKDRLLGAGIVMPGPFGPTGLRGSRSDGPIWDDIAPDLWFADTLGIPVAVENDANAAAIAERISGVAQGLDTYAFIYFGSGLGLGAVHKGRIISGAFGNAGEIGHIPVTSDGKTRLLEDVVSRFSVQRALAKEGIDVDSGDDLDRLYQQNHPILESWLDAAIEPLSAAITIIENLLDPQAIILGGAMPDSILEHFVQSVRPSDHSVSNRMDRGGPRVLRGASGRMTATLGAAALVINQAFTPKISAQL